MRRLGTPVLIVGCLAALTLACYGGVLLRGEQFGYRDAAHFYYPLYQRVQADWAAHRWPLWEPEENGGMPLLGNPTAAVLYPGKLIFAAVPYPVGARLYAVAHTLLAFAAVLAMMRTWGTSWTGSSLAGLGYAFGAPVLFQYCNIIYLVGAAWVPLGFRAVDRWLRLGRRVALLELAAVLSMETLGGDPESAYLTGVCAAGYAAMLARGRASEEQGLSRGRWRRWLIPAGLVLTAAAWVTGTLAVASWTTAVRPRQPTGQPPLPLPWMPYVAPAVAAGWAAAGLVLLSRWRRGRRNGEDPRLMPMLAGLLAAALLSAAVSSAQLLPVLEFTGQSVRAAGGGPHDIYPFSLEPARVVEFLWPNPFGTPFHGNRSWQTALPPAGKAVKVWVPSLYAGGMTVVLALGGLGLGRDKPWRGWLAAVAAVTLVGSFGEFSSPLWWARLSPRVAARIGPQDAPDVAALRLDRQLRDGDGSVYWALATALPGFRQFRFPSKLLTFTVLAVAALAGQGWDGLASGDPRARRRTAGWAAFFFLLSAAAAVGLAANREAMAAWLTRQPGGSAFGPLDVPGAIAATLQGLLQGATVYAAAALLVVWVRVDRRAWPAAVLALGVMTADLAAANARYVLTVPQRDFETYPEALAAIDASEKEQPEPGPYRVHRVPMWNPITWQEKGSDDRVRDFVEWERATIQPKYGLPYGVHYTLTIGVAELYDYEWFFGAFYMSASAEVARALGTRSGADVVVYPRRAFDMWNTRYFILPYYPKWKDEHRGIASFLDQSDRVYPTPDAFAGPGGRDKELAWVKSHDFQVRRNSAAYPRAWVVHGARFLEPIRGLDRLDRDKPMRDILYANDPLWADPTRTVYDPKRVVWLDAEARLELAPYLTGIPTRTSEVATVTRHEPDRVELSVTLERPGMVVLSDVYYPGWTLTMDGRPATVYRANRMMRGAAVPAGRHTLVYTYRPESFRIGLAVSCVGLVLMAGLGVLFAVRPGVPREESRQ